ncbi:MAG: redoxin domain-containing protein [Planctomycetes bacterium]|nr:redoxin domain-containing protein [Planctomycetota bacterium]
MVRFPWGSAKSLKFLAGFFAPPRWYGYQSNHSYIEVPVRRNLLTLALLASISVIATCQAPADDESRIGKPAFNFRLPDVNIGRDVQLSDLKEKIVVVIFYSHTCTFCKQYEARFRQLASDYAGKRIAFLAIDSTGRSAQEAAAAWKTKNMGFPLLRDDRARTAAALGATAMTTVCIIDARGNLRYIGAFDDSEAGKDIRSRYVADAVAALLAGKTVPHEQTEVYGCMIPSQQ